MPHSNQNALYLTLALLIAMVMPISFSDSDWLMTSSEAQVSSVESDLAIYNKTVGFIERMKAEIQSRGGKTYTDVEVRDNIEASLNLQFTNPSLPFKNFDIATDTFQLKKTGNVSTAANVQKVYDAMVAFASDHFYGIVNPDKFPVLYDLEIVSSSPSEMRLSIVSTIGKTPYDPTPFGPDDYWHAGYNAGKCGPFDGQGKPSDGLEQLEKFVNRYYTYGYGCSFFTEIESFYMPDDETLYNSEYIWSSLNSNDPIPGDGFRDYLTWKIFCDYQIDPNVPDCPDPYNSPDEFEALFCLNPDDMNWYYNNFINLFNEMQVNSGKRLIQMDIYRADALLLDYLSASTHGFVRIGVINSCIGGQYPILHTPNSEPPN